MDSRRGQDSGIGVQPTYDPHNPREQQLAIARAELARTQAETRGRVTTWTFVVAGVVFALTVLAFATGESWLRSIATLVCVATAIGSGLVFRAVTGERAPAVWSGPITLWAIPLVLVVVAAIVLVRPAVDAVGSPAPAWILAAVVAASSILYGVLSGRAISRRRGPSS